jgi:hypothetical protein
LHELNFFGLHELKTGVPPTSIYSIELAASELRTIAATTGFEELKINYGLKTDASPSITSDSWHLTPHQISRDRAPHRFTFAMP